VRRTNGTRLSERGCAEECWVRVCGRLSDREREIEEEETRRGQLMKPRAQASEREIQRAERVMTERRKAAVEGRAASGTVD
jgi:hypothetical protein